MSDDDIDALLDDALEDFDTQQKAAQERSDVVAATRQQSAKILEDTLNQQEGAAADAQLDPEKIMAMLAQFSQMQQQQQPGGGALGPDGKPIFDPSSSSNNNNNAGVSEEQEEKLLMMARTLIQGVAASTQEQGEKQQLSDALSALDRVQQLSKQHNDTDMEENPEKAAKVRQELEEIAEKLSKQASESAEKFKNVAGDDGTAPPTATSSSANLPPNPDGTPAIMTDAERQQFAEVMHQIYQLQHQHNSNGGGAAAPAAAASSSASASNTSVSSQQEQQQQLSLPKPSSEDMFNYSMVIYRSFGMIADQYAEWFAGDGKSKKAAGNISEDDWTRYCAQKNTIEELLSFKERHLEILNAARAAAAQQKAGSSSMSDEEQKLQDQTEARLADELKEIVERLGKLGDPPPGFKV